MRKAGESIRLTQDVHVKAYMRNGKPVSAHERGSGPSTDEPVILKRIARSYNDARNALGRIARKPLTSKDGFIADLSRSSIDKIMSGKAVSKSVSIPVHLAAAANIDQLFEASKEGKGSGAGNKEGIKRFRRFYAPFKFAGETFKAKISVKEFEDKSQGNRIYTIETMDIKK